MPTLGTTLFSFTPDWRSGAEVTSVLEQVADAGCGPAIEVIGHQAWRGFPRLSAATEREFRDAVDRLGLRPVALGVYTDLFRRPGRTLSLQEAYDDLCPQLDTAARLGFPLVRATLGMAPDLLRRAAAEAERLGIVLTFEVQGPTAPDDPAVLEVLTLQAASGTPYLGLTIDFSLTTPALPDCFGVALRRLGAAEDVVAAVSRAWELTGPLGQRLPAALAALHGSPHEAELPAVVSSMFVRTGHWQPADWRHVLPVVRHAHAKFWDPDVEATRAPHGAWLAALASAGYTGAVVSEWGGHELLDRADADPLDVTRAHLDVLNELSAQRTAVPA